MKKIKMYFPYNPDALEKGVVFSIIFAKLNKFQITVSCIHEYTDRKRGTQ